MERENGENICIFLVYLGMLHTMLISCLFSTRRTRYIVYMLCVFFPLITESYEVESNDHKIKCEWVKLFVCIAKKELVNRAYSSTLYAKKEIWSANWICVKNWADFCSSQKVEKQNRPAKSVSLCFFRPCAYSENSKIQFSEKWSLFRAILVIVCLFILWNILCVIRNKF